MLQFIPGIGTSEAIYFSNLSHHVIRICQGKHRQASVENQKLSITGYAKTKSRNEIVRVSETESGAKSYKQRKLGGLVDQIQTGMYFLPLQPHQKMFIFYSPCCHIATLLNHGILLVKYVLCKIFCNALW